MGLISAVVDQDQVRRLRAEADLRPLVQSRRLAVTRNDLNRSKLIQGVKQGEYPRHLDITRKLTLEKDPFVSRPYLLDVEGHVRNVVFAFIAVRVEEFSFRVQRRYALDVLEL